MVELFMPFPLESSRKTSQRFALGIFNQLRLFPLVRVNVFRDAVADDGLQNRWRHGINLDATTFPAASARIGFFHRARRQFVFLNLCWRDARAGQFDLYAKIIAERFNGGAVNRQAGRVVIAKVINENFFASGDRPLECVRR